MKIPFLTAVLSTAASVAFAQTFTPSASYSATPLFTEPFDVCAIGSDTSGQLYYLEIGKFDSANTTTQLRMAGSDTPLFDYQAKRYGDFVKVSGNTVYFGESSIGTVRALDLPATGSPRSVATIANNYDLALQGASGFVDFADANFTNNQVATLNTSSGLLANVLVTGGASGPLAVAANGDLLYGGSAYQESGSLYRFTAKQISDAASGKTGELTLSQGVLTVAASGNQYLAYQDEKHVFSAYTDYNTNVNLLHCFDLTNGNSFLAGQIGASDIFSGLAETPNGLVALVSANFGAGPSTAFLITPVPEPAVAAYGLLGLAACIGCRLRRSTPV